MYNFGPPTHLKAYIDNIVRMNKTYAFDTIKEQPYSGLLDHQKLWLFYLPATDMILICLLPFTNHVESSIKNAFHFIGIQQFHEIVIEYQKYSDEQLQQPSQLAEAKTIQWI